MNDDMEYDHDMWQDMSKLTGDTSVTPLPVFFIFKADQPKLRVFFWKGLYLSLGKDGIGVFTHGESNGDVKSDTRACISADLSISSFFYQKMNQF